MTYHVLVLVLWVIVVCFGLGYRAGFKAGVRKVIQRIDEQEGKDRKSVV